MTWEYSLEHLNGSLYSEPFNNKHANWFACLFVIAADLGRIVHVCTILGIAT